MKIIPLGPTTKLAINVEPEDDGRRSFLEDSFRPDPTAAGFGLSRDTTAACFRPPLIKSSDSINHFALVSAPKKSLDLGGLFKKSERN